ncbi:MAG: ATP synthase F1 subunit gamma [Chloroflexota bacterium]
MPSLRDIRRQIRSTKNVAQITKAMETVAASRLRRAQERVTASRPFVARLEEVLAELAGAATGDDVPPLLAVRQVRNSALVLMSPARGLKGALPSNLNRQAARFVADETPATVETIAVGRKGRDFLARRGVHILADFLSLPDRPALADVAGIAQLVVKGYANQEFDRVSLLYTQFVGMTSQRPVVKRLLPVVPPEGTERHAKDVIYEPTAVEVLNQLLPRYVETLIYQALLEEIASEHAAQMVAMRSATDNANDVINDLTRTYNKVRQATITREITEIASGAEAMANA